MLAWLILNWRWALPTGAAVALGVMLGVSRMELASERAARAEERYAAAELQAKMEKEAHEKDNQNAELARDLDAARAKADADIAAGRADFDRQLADVLRKRRQACTYNLPAAPSSAGAAPDVAAGSDGRSAAADSGRRLRELVLSLQADVKECVVFVNKIGR